MFNKLNYAFDAETGEIVTPTELSKKLNKKKKNKTKKNKKINPIEIISRELRYAKDKFNKNGIKDIFFFCRIQLLESINNDSIIEIDGLYLSSLIIYRHLLDKEIINLELVKIEKDFLININKYITKPIVLKYIQNILSYIDKYFDLK